MESSLGRREDGCKSQTNTPLYEKLCRSNCFEHACFIGSRADSAWHKGARVSMTPARCITSSIRTGRSRCRTTGSWDKWVGRLPTSTTIFGCISARVRLTLRKTERYSNRNVRNAAFPHRQSSSSTKPVKSSTPGAGYIPGWPSSEHGILVDNQGYVWIAGRSSRLQVYPGRQVGGADRPGISFRQCSAAE